MKPNKPYLVGLTGGIASGKSTLSRVLREGGAPVIDADKISQGLTMVDGLALPALREAFGEAIFDEEALDRRALGELVFSDPGQLERLNAIMHPLIRQEMERQLESLEDEPAVVLDVPLLYETGWAQDCDEVWCAYVPTLLQLRRLRKRDGLSLKQAWQRVKSQMRGRERSRLADHVINTSGTKEQSAQRVMQLWRAVLNKVRNA